MKPKPDLVALYDVWLKNGLVLFLEHWAGLPGKMAVKTEPVVFVVVRCGIVISRLSSR